mmetsp:Transcript_12243/g.37055  ORF Transcript_12243/g.37055 Transcript_12243/m.37055 type:complete len:254 (-) Transcript_12243:334-1095(-)
MEAMRFASFMRFCIFSCFMRPGVLPWKRWLSTRKASLGVRSRPISSRYTICTRPVVGSPSTSRRLLSVRRPATRSSPVTVCRATCSAAARPLLTNGTGVISVAATPAASSSAAAASCVSATRRCSAGAARSACLASAATSPCSSPVSIAPASGCCCCTSRMSRCACDASATASSAASCCCCSASESVRANSVVCVSTRPARSPCACLPITEPARRSLPRCLASSARSATERCVASTAARGAARKCRRYSSSSS